MPDRTADESMDDSVNGSSAGNGPLRPLEPTEVAARVRGRLVVLLSTCAVMVVGVCLALVWFLST